MTDEERTILWEGKYLRIRRCGRWEYAERSKGHAGVVIIAVTPEGKVILTEQYRVPMACRVIEFPAGLAGDEDDTNEELLAAARRELLEETGYEAAEWEQLVSGPPSAGLSNEIVILFRARGLKCVSQGGGAEAEDITVHKIPLPELVNWLHQKEREGLAIDPKIYAGLYFLGQAPAGPAECSP